MVVVVVVVTKRCVIVGARNKRGVLHVMQVPEFSRVEVGCVDGDSTFKGNVHVIVGWGVGA
jgi:hypothetical protein